MSGYLIALLAAVVWGFAYALGTHVMSIYPPYVLLLLHGIATLPLAILLFVLPDGREALQNLIDGKLLLFIVAEVVLSVVAGFLILLAITKGNPVTAALIETSYPLFIAIATFVIFGHNLLSLPLALGGLFIVIGIAILVSSA